MADVFFDECKMHPFVMRTISDAVSTLKQDQRDNKETFGQIERKIDRLDEKVDAHHDSTSGKITALEKAIIDFLAAQKGLAQGRAQAEEDIKTKVRTGWRVIKWAAIAVGVLAAGGGATEIVRLMTGGA